MQNAKVLSNFFSNIVKNLEIPQFNQVNPICLNIKDPVIKAIINPFVPNAPFLYPLKTSE